MSFSRFYADLITRVYLGIYSILIYDFSKNLRHDTVNQHLFASHKILQGFREPCRRKYFSPRTSPCHMVVITTRVCMRLTRKNQSSRTNLSPVNREIMLMRLKICLQQINYTFIRCGAQYFICQYMYILYCRK